VATAKRDAERERERGSKLFDSFFFASSSLNQNQNNCATPGKEKTGGGKKKAESESGNERREGDNLTSNKTKENDPPEKRARAQTGRAREAWQARQSAPRATEREREREGGRRALVCRHTH